MTSPWAISLPPTTPNPAVALRLVPGIEVHQGADRFWLRGPSYDEALDMRLRSLPDALRFDVFPDGRLQPWNSRLPGGRIPKGPWQAIREWFPIELPVARLVGRGPRRISVSLVPSSRFQPASLLVTRAADWISFATTAARLRLDRLTFAASEDGRIVIRGEPLPPLRGQRFCEDSRIAVPCGWEWPAGMDSATIRQALGLDSSELALFSSAGTWERIAGDEFVRATRSAARLLVRGEADRHVL